MLVDNNVFDFGSLVFFNILFILSSDWVIGFFSNSFDKLFIDSSIGFFSFSEFSFFINSSIGFFSISSLFIFFFSLISL